MFLRKISLAAALLAALTLAACSTTAPPTLAPTAATAPADVPSTAPTTPAEPTTPAAPSATTAPIATTAPALAPTAAPRVMAPPSPAELDALTLALQPFAGGLELPVFLTHAGGDASAPQFIIEKRGRIRAVVGGALIEQPFLDITDRVGSSGNEQGLLGLAFAPDYAESGFFYINYTDRNGDTLIARYQVTADPLVADPASETDVLAIAQPAANHNGGMLAFGPDGYLWIGMGDGGGANDTYKNGQNPDSLLGKMLRLDVTSILDMPYVIPADNPFLRADLNGQDVRDEVWAVGLRNPWRFSFDRATGALWIGDVGQNALEEVDYVAAGPERTPAGGLNFGWPLMEGLECFREANCSRAGLELPVVQYRHGADGCSITGGYVYRGDAYPALRGVYLYGDYCSGRIWGLTPDGNGGWYNRLLAETGAGLSSFGEDQAGELYAVNLSAGTVQRIGLK